MCFLVAGQEDSVYAKKNYDKYLSALKNSGLVSVEEKTQAVTADVPVGAEGGAGAMALLGKATFASNINNIKKKNHIFYFYEKAMLGKHLGISGICAHMVHKVVGCFQIF